MSQIQNHPVSTAPDSSKSQNSPKSPTAKSPTSQESSAFQSRISAHNISKNAAASQGKTGKNSPKPFADSAAKSSHTKVFTNPKFVDGTPNNSGELPPPLSADPAVKQKNKHVRRREKKRDVDDEMPQDVPNLNFNFNNPRFVEYFSNEVGPMYSGSSAQYLENIAHHPQFQYQNQMQATPPTPLNPNLVSFPQTSPQVQALGQSAPIFPLQSIPNQFQLNNVPQVSTSPGTIQNIPNFNHLNMHQMANNYMQAQQNLHHMFNQKININNSTTPQQNFLYCPNVNYSNHMQGAQQPVHQNFANNYGPQIVHHNQHTFQQIGKDGSPRVQTQNGMKNSQYMQNLQQHPFFRNMANLTQEKQSREQPATVKQEQPKQSKSKKNKNSKQFENYLSLEEVAKGLKDNKLFEGVLRINPKQYQHAYITTNRDEQDVFIDGLKKRNRAMEGDIVVIEIVEKEKTGEDNEKSDSEYEDIDLTDAKEDGILTKDGEIKEETRNNPRGKVVFIKEKIHPRICTGYLKLMPDKNRQRALFVPRDHRVPRLNIPATSWPDNFYKEAKSYENIIFLAKIVDWNDFRFAMGTIIRCVGKTGDLYTEMMAILSENCLDVTPFGPEVKHFFPGPDFAIPEEEISKREDCRKLCIFSIDPSTCRDIDDAMSCRPLENGNFEIGVHISDVSFYLKENTTLDAKVADKATTIYLVEKAFHMLPEELCMLCSLFPGVDKLAFSVFWEITENADILNHRFARTVINSCAQLAYEHAQVILDDTEISEFPEVHNGFTLEDITCVVKVLGKLSSMFRERRFDGGALRIDQQKLSFHLDIESGLPDSFHIHESKHSHQLIEEFMLLANMTVAERIYKDHPQIAFLRRHQDPSKFQLIELQTQLKALGIELDISSAGSLYRSIHPYIGAECENQQKAVVLSMMCTKPMTRAQYFCANNYNFDELGHYALNVPLYTHFTSPIRRYADIMVHRLLAASMKYTETPNWETDKVQYIAANCNKQKYNAKRAGEKSVELYTLKYIEMNSPIRTEAVVVDVKDKSFDVIVLSMNLNRRIYIENMSDVRSSFQRGKNNKLSKLEITWPGSAATEETHLTVEIFTVIQIEMTKGDDILKIETRLVRPL